MGKKKLWIKSVRQWVTRATRSNSQMGEQRLNLNRSWYKDHSHAYNTPFYFKSYTKDLSPPIFTVAFKPDNPSLFRWGLGHAIVWSWSRSSSVILHNMGRTHIDTFSLDSGLEAFSRNPAHGSFSALTFQSTDLPIMWTNGSSRTKLDYCRVDDFISRVKLTCLTTV